MAVPLQMGAAEFKALGAVGADTTGLYHGKTPDQVIVVDSQVAVALLGRIRLGHGIVPVLLRAGGQSAVQGAHLCHRGPLFTLAV